MLFYAIRNGFAAPEWFFSASDDPLTADSVSFSEGLTRLMALGTPAGAGARTQANRPPEPREAPLFSADRQILPPFGGTKILCVGRNYRPHAEELGNPLPKEPLWFSKPPSSLLADGGFIDLPVGFGRIDYEGELALVLGRRVKRATPDEAIAAVAGVTPALDITARELQKADGQWTRAKGFDTFCPLGPLVAPYSPAWNQADLEVKKNDVIVQSDSLASLVFPFGMLISHLSQCMTLEPGDVILTGTPAGVGPLSVGDRLEVTLRGPQTLRLAARVAAPRS